MDLAAAVGVKQHPVIQVIAATINTPVDGMIVLTRFFRDELAANRAAICCARSIAPPFSQSVVMLVARNVEQQLSSDRLGSRSG